jgi:LysM repeat protein
MEYRIRSGDTLSGIAEKFGISLSALAAANAQVETSGAVFLNELVRIPGPAVPVEDLDMVLPAAVATYVVQHGDSMASIAAAHNLSQDALEAANPQVTSATAIQVGETLNLVGGAVAATPVAASSGAIPIKAVTYGKYTGTGTVTSWTTRACQLMGLPPANWVRGYKVLCARESSGLPNAINHYDSNAWGPIQSDGFPLHCSRGIAQCIPDTFAAFHEPRTSQDIYNPVANIAASMHYVMVCYHVSANAHDLAAKVQQADPNRPPHGYWSG